jgi:quercetin dioxygenase-like cupin family protein
MTFRIRRFDEPDSTTTFELGKVDLLTVAALSIGRARYEPGWRWSEHIGAATGQRFCQASHVGIVVAGRNRVEMVDGQVFEMGPGDVFEIGPGHDSLVIGDEPYESLHLGGVDAYVEQADRSEPSKTGV